MLSPSVHGIDAYVMDVANSQCSSNIQRKINVRYVAADGNDANDGLTPATAWRTIAKLNSGLPSGGAALLRCGDVFYGMIEVKGGIDSAHRTVITSYGNGPKPVISCTKNLRCDPEIWQTKAARYNYWYMDLNNPSNYSGIVSDDANPGFLVVDGEVNRGSIFAGMM